MSDMPANNNNSIPGQGDEKGGEKLTLSQRFADAVTEGMGSWPFVIGQVALIAAWIGLNKANIAPIPQWDPNLILLNLTLSVEAALGTAFVLMSQKRSAEKDRLTAQNDYQIDVEAERNIRELNRKMDILLAEHKKAATQPATAAPPAKTPINDNGETAKPAAVPAPK